MKRCIFCGADLMTMAECVSDEIELKPSSAVIVSVEGGKSSVIYEGPIADSD
jgi:hypothetical protein